MNRLWDSFFGGLVTDGETEGWIVPLDVVEEGDNVIVRASLPGVRPEDLEVSLEENMLSIRAQTQAEEEREHGRYLLRERRVGSFYRSIRLPQWVDADKAEARYEHGVLTLTVPKAESKKARRLEVKAGSTSKVIEGKK